MTYPITTTPGIDLDEVAAAFARREADEADAELAELVTAAIRGWRLDEATFWQRVRFKARLLRAAHRRGSVAGE